MQYTATLWPNLVPQGPVSTVGGTYPVIPPINDGNHPAPPSTSVPGVYTITPAGNDTTAHPVPAALATAAVTAPSAPAPNPTTYEDPTINAKQTRDFFKISQNEYPPSNYPPVPSGS
jgi:hypothetical protein